MLNTYRCVVTRGECVVMLVVLLDMYRIIDVGGYAVAARMYDDNIIIAAIMMMSQALLTPTLCWPGMGCTEFWDFLICSCKGTCFFL